MRKPDSIIHWLDSIPPPHHSFLNAIQQIAFLGVYMGVIRLYAHEMNLSLDDFQNLMATSLIISGLGVILQAYGRFGLGSGYFCPLQVTPAAFSAMTAAFALGGLNMAFGMLIVVGLTQMILGEAFKRMQAVFTVEVAGVAVVMMGLSLGTRGLNLLAGEHSQSLGGQVYAIGHSALLMIITLGAMISVSVWSTGWLRLSSAIAGLLLGILSAFFLGDIQLHDLFNELQGIPLLKTPKIPVFGWDFDPSLIPSFMVVGLALSLHGFGATAVAQRFNDAEWKRPEMRSVCRGLRVEGLSNILCGLLNAMPLTSSAGAVSLAAATGCTSRHIALWLGGLMICFSFVPKITSGWFLIPLPITGAAVVFLSIFTLMAGIQMICSRMLDNRKIIAIGASIILGISHEPLQHYYHQALPDIFHSITLSSVALATSCACFLSLVFRIRSRTRMRKCFIVSLSTLDDVIDFLEQQGKAWGARPNVVKRAEYATWQAFETLVDHHLVEPDSEGIAKINMETIYDEFCFTIVMQYQGGIVPLNLRPPSHEQLLKDDSALILMAGYLIQKLADKVHARLDSTGLAELCLTFKD